MIVNQHEIVYVDVQEALAAATGGSLCVRRRRPPHNFSSLVAKLRTTCDVQYICLDEDCLQWLVRPGPIEIPPITARRAEVPKIIDEYVLDAVIELAPASNTLALSERDRRWLRENAANMSLSEIEKAALRLVALRNSPNLSHAASRLGMAPVSLARWVARRKLPAYVDAATPPELEYR